MPQLLVEVDREKAIALGVPVSDIFDALQSTMGALYVNDFNKFGRTYRVQIQAESAFRAQARGSRQRLRALDARGEMLPLKSAAHDQADRRPGADRSLQRASSRPRCSATRHAGFSSGQAIAAVEEVAAKSLPDRLHDRVDRPGLPGKAHRHGVDHRLHVRGDHGVPDPRRRNYERWSLPVAVLLAVPFALLGALLAVLLRGMSNDVYFQIGLLVLIGLAAKNAILIVEFAAQEMAKGLPPREAAIEAARLRFRPDRDDVARVRAGRGAAGARHRRRRRVAAIDGHRRVRRHADRDVRRHDVHPAVLRASREASRARVAAAPPPCRGRARPPT